MWFISIPEVLNYKPADTWKNHKKLPYNSKNYFGFMLQCLCTEGNTSETLAHMHG